MSGVDIDDFFDQRKQEPVKASTSLVVVDPSLALNEETARQVFVAATQGANGAGVEEALAAAARGLLRAHKILKGDRP